MCGSDLTLDFIKVEMSVNNDIFGDIGFVLGRPGLSTTILNTESQNVSERPRT